MISAKLREGRRSTSEKIAAGGDERGRSHRAPAVAVNGPSAVSDQLQRRTVSFTPTLAGSVYMLSVEARGTNLARSGTERMPGRRRAARQRRRQGATPRLGTAPRSLSVFSDGLRKLLRAGVAGGLVRIASYPDRDDRQDAAPRATT